MGRKHQKKILLVQELLDFRDIIIHYVQEILHLGGTTSPLALSVVQFYGFYLKP